MKSFLTSIRYCILLSWQTSRIYTIIRLLVNLVYPLYSLITAYLVKNILDLLTSKRDPDEKFYILIILTLIIFLMSAINTSSEKLNQYTTRLHDEMILNNISLSMMEKAMDSDIELYDNQDFYDKFNKMQYDSYSMSGILWNSLSCISGFFSLICVLTALFNSNPIYAFAIIIVSIPAAIFEQRCTKQIYQNDLEQVKNQRQRHYYNIIATTKSFAQELRYRHLSDYIKNKYMSLSNTIFFSKKKLIKRKTWVSALLSILPEVSITGISIHIIYKVIHSIYTIGDYTLYRSLVSQVYSNIILLTMNAMSLYDNKLKIDNMLKLDVLTVRRIKSGSREINAVKTIEFKNVSFQYPDTTKIVLDDVSFKVGLHEKVALVGLNGSGKTTIIKLLLRLYDVTAGEILINNKDIREFQIEKLHRCYNVYFQNAPNFAFTLRENVILNEEVNENSDCKIKEILKACEALDILNSTGDNLDTYITKEFSDKGVELSAGQHQKLAIARSIYRNASAYILDEPSSSLDPEAESRIFEKLEKVCYNKLAIFTSHRLTNVHLADRIIVLEKGKVVEQGTQKELLAHPKRFAALFQYQAQKFQQ